MLVLLTQHYHNRGPKSNTFAEQRVVAKSV